MKFGTTLLLALLLIVPSVTHAQAGIATTTQPMANQISCPVSELKYGFAQSFPDPWFGTEKVVSDPLLVGAVFSYGPYSATVAGKQMLACRWQGYGGKATLYVQRPIANVALATYPCPATLPVKVVTSLPSPWLGTTYNWALTEKGTTETHPQYASALPNSNFCAYSGTAPLEILYPLPVTAQQGMTGLATPPPPKIDQLAQNFLVTKAQLAATPSSGRATCPTTVRFDAHIATNGPGTVQYRRQVNGQTSPLQSLTFTSAGEKIVSFQTQAAQSQQQVGGVALTTQVQASNVVNGQARVIIQSPAGVPESNVASYQITCTNVAPVGNVAQAGAPSPTQPATATLAAPARTGTTTARAAAASRRIEFASQRIPLRVRDGRNGWAQLNVSGQIGGRATGRMTLSLSALGARAATTTYQIQSGVLQYEQTDYSFTFQGTAQTAGESASRRFSSRLKLVPTRSGGIVWNYVVSGVEHTDNWRENQMATGDVWVIDGLTCQWSGRDLLCQ